MKTTFSEKAKRFGATLLSAATFLGATAASATPVDDRDDRRVSKVQVNVQETKVGGATKTELPGQELQIVLGQHAPLRFNAFMEYDDTQTTKPLSFDLPVAGKRGVVGTKGMRFDTLSLEINTKHFDLEVGKMSPQRGYLWYNMMPGYRYAMSARDASQTLAVRDQVGVRAVGQFNTAKNNTLRISASATRTFAELNNIWMYGAGVGAGGLTDSWTPSLILSVDNTIKTSNFSRLTIGAEASRLAQGADNSANELSGGGHAKAEFDLIKASGAALVSTTVVEAAVLKNAKGNEGAQQGVVTAATMLEAIFNDKSSKNWFGPYALASVSSVEGNKSPDAETVLAAEFGANARLWNTVRINGGYEVTQRSKAGSGTGMMVGAAFNF